MDKHGEGTVTTAKGRQVTKPNIVNRYNKCMGGVDCSDAMRLANLGKRCKWTKKFVFALIGRAALNAFIIYDRHCASFHKLCRYCFMVQLVEFLMGNW
ncbi:hypothetical protein RRG08_001879 [Elysia crispata]|uniref:PiggyBac transposable element-derived protein domain-containing protein n=1 Tax=Elysia crispata TaxID=231223 RepID=A0AAE1A3P4_9GAST|nr:hypothetical protein RRG08_001879 [Elysia crispata]